MIIIIVLSLLLPLVLSLRLNAPIMLLHIWDILWSLLHIKHVQVAMVILRAPVTLSRWGWLTDQRHFTVTVSRTFHWFDKLWTKLTFDDSWMDNVVLKPNLKVFLPLMYVTTRSSFCVKLLNDNVRFSVIVKNVIFFTYEKVTGKSYSLEISFTVCQKYSIMMLD